MADSSNGDSEREYKEVVVEDTVAGEESKDTSIVESIADAAEKIFGRSSSSSSSSSSDDEKESEPIAAAKNEAELCVEVVENVVPIEETKLESVVEEGEACAVEKIAEAEAKIPVGEEEEEEDESKVVAESVCVVASEAAIENAQIPESTDDISGMPVTRESLQAASWKSCCGLFEVLNRSER